MPTYTFRKKENHKDVWIEQMSMSEREKYLEEHPEVEQIIGNFSIGDPIKLGLKKPDDGFRDILRRVKEHHPLGRNINTF
jgi:hypothetical protein